MRRKEQGNSKCGARKPGSGWIVMDNEGTSCVKFPFKSLFGMIVTSEATYLHLLLKAKTFFCSKMDNLHCRSTVVEKLAILTSLPFSLSALLDNRRQWHLALGLVLIQFWINSNSASLTYVTLLFLKLC